MEETLRIVDAQTQEAAAKKEVVEGEEAIASEKAAAAKAIKVSDHHCDRDSQLLPNGYLICRRSCGTSVQPLFSQ